MDVVSVTSPKSQSYSQTHGQSVRSVHFADDEELPGSDEEEEEENEDETSVSSEWDEVDYVPEWGEFRNRCRRIVLGDPRFDQFWLAVIVVNCIVLSLEDPTDKNCETVRCTFTTYADLVLTALFIIECIINILGLGFYYRGDSYIRDEWNILDFTIVVSGALVIILEYGFGVTGPGLTGLRAFRLLRPLKAVQAFPAVRILIQSILSAIPKLLNIFVLYFFFILIMGIIAVQQWQGLFRWRCVYNEDVFFDKDGVPQVLDADTATLQPDDGDRICSRNINLDIGGHYCNWNYTCALFDRNPHFGKLSFDNMAVAFLTLFVGLTLEGWTETMYNTMDATSFIASAYYVVLIIFGSFFILNLTVVVITSAFEKKQREQLGNAFAQIDVDGGGELDKDEVRRLLKTHLGMTKLTETQLEKAFSGMDKDNGGTVCVKEFIEYCEVNPMISGKVGNKKKTVQNDDDSDSEDEFFQISNIWVNFWNLFEKKRKRGTPIQRESYRLILWEVCGLPSEESKYPLANKIFGGFIMTAIFLNTITLSIEHHNQPQMMTDIFHVSNIIFTHIFAAEVVLKLYAMGGVAYFNDNFNCFDFVIGILSEVDLLFAGEGGTNVSVFRTFRAFRVVKLATKVPMLQKWIGILFKSMKSAAVLTSLLGLMVFIVSLLGMQLFGGNFCGLDPDWEAPDGFDLSNNTGQGCEGLPRSNYDNLGVALLTSFQILTGEDWNIVMYTGMRATGDWVAIYFVIYYVIGNYMMLNLFIAVLLANRDLMPEESNESVAGSDEEEEEEEELEEIEGLQEEAEEDPFLLNEMITSNNIQLEADSPRASWNKLGEGDEKKPSFKRRKSKRKSTATEDDIASPRKRKEIVHGDHLFTRLQESETSMFFLKKDNPLRKAMTKVTESNRFELLVLLAIAMSTITLAIESPLRPPDHPTEVTLGVINYVMIWVFLAECLSKIIAMGFVMHPTSYLRSESWNVLDFIIVVSSIMSLIIPGAERFQIMKIMRAMRPLRFINKSEGMKVVVGALVMSIKPLLNVLLISLLTWIIFAILGVQIFQGKFYQCSLEEYADDTPCSNYTRDLCETIDVDGVKCRWLNNVSHFDNLPAAFLNLFEMASLEGWVTVMNLGMDAVSIDEPPRKNSNPAMALYFIVFVICGAFFIINMFISVLIDTYYTEKEKAEHKRTGIYLNEDQKKWVEHHSKMMTMITYKHRPVKVVIGKGTLLHQVVGSHWFEIVITACIVLNVLVMAAEFYPPSDARTVTFDTLNLVFYLIFLVEFLLKVMDLGFKGYFTDIWNRFDFFIVTLSSVGLIIQAVLSAGPAVSMFRVLRLARLLRMIKKAKDILIILRTLYLSIPSLVNVAGILSLMFFIYAVLGVKLFAKVKRGPDMGPLVNFETFFVALLLLLRMTTGEAWQAILNNVAVQPPDCDNHLGECGQKLTAVLYFCSFTLAGMYVLLNLFIAIILDAFTQLGEANANVCTEEYMDKVKAVWSSVVQAVPGHRGAFGIRRSDVPSFLTSIDKPLGMKGSEHKIEAAIRRMDLHVDPKSNLIPQEEFMAKLFKARFEKDLPPSLHKQMHEKEREVDAPDIETVSDKSIAAAVRIQQSFRCWKSVALRKEAQRKRLAEREPYAGVSTHIWPPLDKVQYSLEMQPIAPGVPLGFGLDPELCRITRVSHNTAAERAGFKPGMLIRSVDHVAVERNSDVATKLIQEATRNGWSAIIDIETADPTELVIEKYSRNGSFISYNDLHTMCRDLGIAGPTTYGAYLDICINRGIDPKRGFGWKDTHAMMATLPDEAQHRILEQLRLRPERPEVCTHNPATNPLDGHNLLSTFHTSHKEKPVATHPTMGFTNWLFAAKPVSSYQSVESNNSQKWPWDSTRQQQQQDFSNPLL